MITTAFLVISWGTVLHDVPDGSGVAAGGGWTRMAYPVVDVVICATVVTLGMRQHAADRGVWLFLGVGVVSLAVADTVYVTLAARGAFSTSHLMGGPLAAAWMLSGVLVGLSTLPPGVVRSGRRTSPC